jgi:hypothetical protein
MGFDRCTLSNSSAQRGNGFRRWGFPDPLEMTVAQRFTSRYRGKRYSIGILLDLT